MAHYAFLDENNIVTKVIVGRDENDLPDGISDWETYYAQIVGQQCKRTSYNTHGAEHSDGGVPFRYNYAGPGFTFDPARGTDGAFIPPKTFESWILDDETCLWVPPFPMPEAGVFMWNEEAGAWVEVTEV
jgi:hypothetical protein